MNSTDVKGEGDEGVEGEGEVVGEGEAAEMENDVGAEQEIDGQIQEPVVPEYTHRPGCTQQIGDGTPLEFFQLLVTESMLDNIVEQTNIYASQYKGSHKITPRSRVQQWAREDFDREELTRFLALIIIMGLVNLPQSRTIGSQPGHTPARPALRYTWLHIIY